MTFSSLIHIQEIITLNLDIVGETLQNSDDISVYSYRLTQILGMSLLSSIKYTIIHNNMWADFLPPANTIYALKQKSMRHHCFL